MPRVIALPYWRKGGKLILRLGSPIWVPAFRVPGTSAESRGLYYFEVSPGFFEAMQIPVLEGREFVARDTEPEHPRMVAVNQAFARRYFPAESPFGKRFETVYSPTRTDAQEIVGVVGDAKYRVGFFMLGSGAQG